VLQERSDEDEEGEEAAVDGDKTPTFPFDQRMHYAFDNFMVRETAAHRVKP
jgi:hypothetical protein